MHPARCYVGVCTLALTGCDEPHGEELVDSNPVRYSVEVSPGAMSVFSRGYGTALGVLSMVLKGALSVGIVPKWGVNGVVGLAVFGVGWHIVGVLCPTARCAGQGDVCWATASMW